MTDSKTKKVLFTSHVATFYKFNLPLMRWFKDNGYEVHYASAGEIEVLGCDRHFKIPFERNPFRINNLRSIQQLKKIIDSESYDIIHTHTPMGGVVTRLAAIDARKKGTRVIYTAHGFHFYKGAPLLNWLAYYPIEKIMSKFTDTIITINKEDFELAKKKFKTDISYVNGVGIDFKQFSPISDASKDKTKLRYGYSKDKIIISCIAEFTKNKNQEFLVKAFKELVKNHKNARLLLVGNIGSDNNIKRWKKIINENNLEDYVELLGYRNDVKEIVRLSDIIVLASAREGLPASLIEAVACGKPVVCTDIRGDRDIKLAAPNLCRLYKYNCIADFIKNVEFFIKNKKLNYDKGIEIFSTKSVIAQMSKIYEGPKTSILHVLSSNKLSGAENVVIGLINKDSGMYCSPDGEIRKTLDENDIEYCEISKLSLSQLKSVINSLHPNVIYAHDFKTSLLVGYFFGKKYNITSYIHQNPDWLDKKNIKTFLYKIVSKKFKKIIVVSSSIKERKLFKSITNTNIVVQYNKVDSDKIIKLAHERIDDNYDLCFVGRLQDVKQPEHFVELVSRIKKTKPDIKAVIVGDGELMGVVKKIISNLNLEENIDIVGFQKNPYKYINSSKILAITSKNEGLPMVVLEAIALEKCVLSYNYPTLIDLFKGDKKDTRFLCCDMDKMSRVISDLLLDDIYYRKTIIFQKMRVSQLYNLNENTLS